MPVPPSSTVSCIFVVNSFEVEDVAFAGQLALQRTVKGAEGAVFSAEIGVVDIAVDDVGNDAIGMQLAAHRVGFHPDADEVVGVIHSSASALVKDIDFTPQRFILTLLPRLREEAGSQRDRK